MRPAAQSSAGYRIRYVANHAGRSDLTSACAAHPTPVSLCSPPVALQLITTVRGAAASASAASSADPAGCTSHQSGSNGVTASTAQRVFPTQDPPTSSANPPRSAPPQPDAPPPASRAGWPG